MSDLRRALDLIAPTDGDYMHNLRWGDGNGYSHVRSALVGATIGATQDPALEDPARLLRVAPLRPRESALCAPVTVEIERPLIPMPPAVASTPLTVI